MKKGILFFLNVGNVGTFGTTHTQNTQYHNNAVMWIQSHIFDFLVELQDLKKTSVISRRHTRQNACGYATNRILYLQLCAGHSAHYQ